MTNRGEAAAARLREADRRAEVLRRHARLQAPTAEQDSAFAAELGITTSRFGQIARAWRLHGEASTRGIEAKSDPERVAEAIQAAEGPLDLSNVPLPQRDEIERRIRLIGRHLRGRAAGVVDRTDYAAEYGASYSMFRQAVTSWLLTPDPAALPGVGRRPSRPAPKARRTAAYEPAVAQAMSELGTDVGLTVLHRRAAQICHRAGIRPPSMSLVHTRLIAARVDVGAKPSEGEGLRLDRVVVEVPAAGERLRTAVLVILFGSSTGRIHAHALAAHPGIPSDAAVLRDYLERQEEESSAGAAALLEWSVPEGEDWTRLADALKAAGVSTWTTPSRGVGSGRHAFPTFGDRIDDLHLGRLDRRSLPRLTPHEPIDPRAEAFVADAIGRHNATRPAGRPPLAPAGTGPSLAASLERTAS